MIDIDPQLQSSYAACRRMHRRFDPTYYWATRRLPREIRPAVHALYGFVRGADELVDGPRPPPPPRPGRPPRRAGPLGARAGRRSGAGALVAPRDRRAGRRRRPPRPPAGRAARVHALDAGGL